MALFRALPSLANRVVRVPLCGPATPVAPLPGYDGVWFKDDGQCGDFYGGCKTRKLEFLLGRARQWKATHLVTAGALGTHHGLATARAGIAQGFAVTILLVPQPWSDEVERNLAAMRAAGASLVFAGGTWEAGLRGLRVAAKATGRLERVHWVASGGSSVAGHLGFVRAAFELAEQIQAGLLPEPDDLYIPLGTGGCCIGLLAGFALAGLSTRVIGVRTSDVLPVSARSVLSAANGLVKFIGRRAPEAPRCVVARDRFECVDGQLGGGLGHATPEGVLALQKAAEVGLILDETYTAKCFAELLKRRQSDTTRRVLFWNTHADALGAGAERSPESGLELAS